MGKLLEGFMEYYESASEEQKAKDFEELKEYNEYGPSAKSILINNPVDWDREYGSKWIWL